MRGLLVLGMVLASASFHALAAEERKPATISDLIQQLSSKDFHIRQRAAKQLGNLGLAARDAVPILGKALRDPLIEVRSSAAKALAAIGVPAVPVLIEALKDPAIKNQHVRIAHALARIGPPAKDAVPALAALLKGRGDAVRLEALIALGEIGSEAQAALPVVVQLLVDPNESVRKQALATLKQVGPPAIPILKDALGEKSVMLRLAAMHALAVCGLEAKETIPALCDALKDTDPRIRAHAAAALGSMGKAAKDAIPNLLDALLDKKLIVQDRAAHALVGMASQGIPGVLEQIRVADRKMHWAEPVILKQFGKTAAENVKVLIGKLQDKDPNVRAQAAMALTVFGAAAQPAVASLTKALQDENDSVRLMSAMALLQIEPKNKEAFKVVNAALGTVPAMQLAVQGQKRQIEPALEDPVLQAQFDRIIHLYIIEVPIAKRVPQMWMMLKALDGMIESLPPEAVPALVRGMNLAAAYQIGSC